MPKDPGLRFSILVSEKIILTLIGLALLILKRFLKV